MSIDVTMLALALHRQEFEEFRPVPRQDIQPAATQRQAAWRWLRRLMIVSAGALLLLSALNTFPVFYHMMAEHDWGWAHDLVAAIQGGAAVLGYEVFLISSAMMLRLLPPRFPGVRWVKFAFALAFLGGLFANQDALFAPLISGTLQANVWEVLKALVLGSGRFILMIGAGEAAAVIVLGEEHADLSDSRAHRRALEEWNEARLADWRARQGTYRARAQRMIASGTIPAGLLTSVQESAEVGDSATDPFVVLPGLTQRNLPTVSSIDLPEPE